jgi:hypothetical protein
VHNGVLTLYAVGGLAVGRLAVGRLRALFVSSAGHSMAGKTGHSMAGKTGHSMAGKTGHSMADKAYKAGHSRQRKIYSVGIGGLVNNLSVRLVIIHCFTLTNASIASCSHQ